MDSNVHILLYCADQIADLGPANNWWEWSLEGYCGLLPPMVRSRVNPNQALMNEVVAEEYTKLASLILPGHVHYQGPNEADGNVLPTDCGHLMPKKAGIDLFHRQYQRLRQLLRAHFESIGRRICLLPQNAVKYARYRIRGGHLVGSQWGQRVNGTNRASNYIRCQLVWENPNQSTFFYGEVIYFLAITMPDLGDHYLAFVRWWETEALDENEGNRRVHFLGVHGGAGIINVASIDCVVGCFDSGGNWWVVLTSVFPIHNPIGDEHADEADEGPAVWYG